MLGGIKFEHGECAVRVNSVDSGLVTDDLKSVLTGRVLPEAILLPKVESEDHIKWVNFILYFIKFYFILCSNCNTVTKNLTSLTTFISLI